MNTERNNNFPCGNILVVDDNRSNLKLLTDILQRAGYLVRAADDGELALRSVEARPPDLILLDYKMPGINGFEVCRRLKADPVTTDIPVIFISAYGDTDLKVKALSAGGVDYVTKPFEKREVLARIHTHLSMYHLQQMLTNQTRELTCLYSISKLVEEEHSLDAILKGAANIIRTSWIHPEIAGVEINIDNRSFRADNFKKTRCLLSHKVIIASQNIGAVDIYFLEKRLTEEEEPFFVEELNLINAVSAHLGRIIERIRTTEALQASERFSNKILQSSLNGLYIYNLNRGRNIFINRQYTKITGYSLEDINSLKPDEFAEFFHPDDLPHIIDHMEEIKRIDDNEFIEIEYRFKAASGKWVWCLSRDAVFQRSESGEVEQFIGSFIDITERKKTEQALRESKDTMQLLMEAIPEAIFLLDTEGVALAVNTETARRIKKTPDEIIGKCVFDFIPPDLARERKELIGNAIRSGEIVKFTDVRSGNYIENHIHPLRDSSGKVNRVAIMALDVTEKKRAEKEQLRAVADYTYDWESWLAPDGTLKWVNPAVERLTGFSIADCMKMEGYPLPIVHEEERTQFGLLLRQALAEKSSLEEFDFRVSKKSGASGWMSASWQTISAENGAHLGLRISIRDITERKYAEKALDSERQRLYSILDAIPAFIYLLAPDYSIRFANQYSIEHFGTPDGKACYRAIWGQDEPCDNCQTFKVFDTQEPQVWEYNSVLDSRIYEVSDHPFTDIDGTRLVFKLGIDITRRKEAEKALQKAHNGLEQRVKERTVELHKEITERKQITEQLQNIEWLLTRSSQRELSHDHACIPSYGDLTKLNISGVILKSVGRETLNDIIGDFLALLETSSAIYEKNGDYALGIFSSGWCQFLDCASRNLCQSMNNQEALKSGLWLCHESCWNDASRVAIETGQPTDIECHGGIRIFAVPIRSGLQIIGAINFGYGEPPKDRQKLEELAIKYNVNIDELIEKAQDYKSRPQYILDIAKQRLVASARLIGEMVERKRAETALKISHEQLLHAEKLSAIGNLSASIAHEFNNPLQGVMNIIKGVQKRVPLDKDEMKLVNMAIRECNRMRDLIKSLQDFNRPTSGKIASVDIHATVESLLLLGKKEYSTRNIKIEKKYAENLPLIKAVSDQIKQVFLNLLNNAVAACYKGGTITVQTEVRNQNVVVRFHDTGIGIKPEDKKHIFEPFFTTKPEVKGTGLGLSVSYGIIKEHGGKITVESTPGKGTTFSVTLPIEGENYAAK